MLPLSDIQFWLCTEPTDMRRSYDGLAAMVKNHLNANPLNGMPMFLSIVGALS